MDFINNLPPSMREALELQQTPEMQMELEIKMKKFLDMESVERPKNEDGYSKTSKANGDQKEHIIQKDEAMERAYDLLSQFAKMNGTDCMAGLYLVSAKRAKDYSWFAKQLGEFVCLFEELKKTLEA
jgi:hypothetical protein